METRTEILKSVLVDGGPLYIETRLDRLVAEPFNAVSASFFIFIAVYWLWKLRQELRANAFFVTCAVLLLLGGVGGTLFHGTRASRVFLMMDVLPIVVICTLAGAYFWRHLLGQYWLAGMALVILPTVLGMPLAHRHLPIQVAITLSYLVFAFLVIVPLFLTLYKTQFRHGSLVIGSLFLFLVALICRVADSYAGTSTYLPMGSHWLWHSFSAFAVALVFLYLRHFTVQNQTVRRAAKKKLK